jgi:hypothetical protein
MDRLRWEGLNIKSHVIVITEINDKNLIGTCKNRLCGCTRYFLQIDPVVCYEVNQSNALVIMHAVV